MACILGHKAGARWPLELPCSCLPLRAGPWRGKVKRIVMSLAENPEIEERKLAA